MDKSAHALDLFDDAGRQVRAMGQDGIGEELRQDPEAQQIAELIAGRIAQAQSEVEVRTLFKSVVYAVLAMLFVSIVMLGHVAIALIFGVIFGVLAFVTFRRASSERAKRTSDLYHGCRLAYARCAGCGYGLRGITPDELGLVTCPECAAQWDATRFRLAMSEHLRGDFRPDKEAGLSKWLWGFRPVLGDEEGRLHYAADPRLPGSEAWLDNAAGEIRCVVRWRCLWWRGVSVAATLGFAFVYIIACFGSMAGSFAFVQRLTLGAALAAFVIGAMLFVMFRGAAKAWAYRAPWLSRQAAQCLLDEGICPGCARRLEPTPSAVGDPVRCGHCEGVWGAKLPDQSMLSPRIRGFEDSASA